MGMFVDVNKRHQHQVPELEREAPGAIFTLRPLTYSERCERLDLSRGPGGLLLAGTYNRYTLKRGLVFASGFPSQVQIRFELDAQQQVADGFLDCLPQAATVELVNKIDELTNPSADDVKA